MHPCLALTRAGLACPALPRPALQSGAAAAAASPARLRPAGPTTPLDRSACAAKRVFNHAMQCGAPPAPLSLRCRRPPGSPRCRRPARMQGCASTGDTVPAQPPATLPSCRLLSLLWPRSKASSWRQAGRRLRIFATTGSLSTVRPLSWVCNRRGATKLGADRREAELASLHPVPRRHVNLSCTWWRCPAASRTAPTAQVRHVAHQAAATWSAALGRCLPPGPLRCAVLAPHRCKPTPASRRLNTYVCLHSTRRLHAQLPASTHNHGAFCLSSFLPHAGGSRASWNIASRYPIVVAVTNETVSDRRGCVPPCSRGSRAAVPSRASCSSFQIKPALVRRTPSTAAACVRVSRTALAVT